MAGAERTEPAGIAPELDGLARQLGALRVGPAVLATGAGTGPLQGVDIVVKDLFDVTGHRTGAGNPDRLAEAQPAAGHALAVQRLLAGGARVIGKSHTDELAFSLSGTNVHYGTPRNPAAPGSIPGGSSSGSASAVAGGLVPLALATDTGGSTRVPASYCGIYGLRPTHGRIPFDGVVPLAPSFDTVGLLASTGTMLADAGHVLLAGRPGAAPRSLVLGTDLLQNAEAGVGPAVEAAAVDLAQRLDLPLRRAELTGGRLAEWFTAFLARQQYEVWQTHGPWVTRVKPRLGPGIANRFAMASRATAEASRATEAVRDEARAAVDAMLGPDELLVLPAAASVAPALDAGTEEKDRMRLKTLRLTCIAGLGGLPSVSLPLAQVDGMPVGVGLVGRRGDDELLLAVAASLR